jgi:hypothetical protein
VAATYDIGDVVRISDAITTTATGSAIDPTAVSLVLLLPDATETTYTYAGSTITKDSAGNYHVDVTITMAGTHRYRWTSTGTGAASEESWFQVRPRRVV